MLDKVRSASSGSSSSSSVTSTSLLYVFSLNDGKDSFESNSTVSSWWSSGIAEGDDVLSVLNTSATFCWWHVNESSLFFYR